MGLGPRARARARAWTRARARARAGARAKVRARGRARAGARAKVRARGRARASLRVLAQRERVRHRALLADAARLAVAGRRGTEHVAADHATDHGARGLALRECKG